MTIQQIYYALTITSVGSINRAAEQLYMTQPSLTSAIKELENEIGITIFHRTSKGVIPTNEGLEFLAGARQLYQQYELLCDRYRDAEQRKRSFGVSTQHYSFAVKAFVDTVKKYDTSKFDFSIQETRTRDVIQEVADLKSEIGVLFLSDYNRKVITKMLNARDLVFHPLINCSAFVYLWKGHPLAQEQSISISQLGDYPCLTFEQGEESSAFFAEEILSDIEYARRIRTNDRATMLNLMVGLNAYTLCSGIISEELNGTDFLTIPFEEDEQHKNSTMQIGYIVKKQTMMSDVAQTYIEELKKYLGISEAEHD